MKRWRPRLVSVLATLAVAAAGLASPALTAPARAGVATTKHLIPGGVMPRSSGVLTLCYNATGFSCAGGGYNGTPAQIGGNGWTTSEYWSYGSPGPNGTRHNCTTYAAYRLQQNGTPYPGWTGNANQWATKASPSVLVDQTPAVGAIAQWNGGESGHVAYVEAVTATYIVTTSDSYDGGTDRQEIPLNSPYMPDNFIHFKDYYGDIVQWNGDTKAQKTAWRVGADGRRHWIPSISDYWCLVDGGVPGPYQLPSDVLTNVVPDDPGSQAPCGGDLNGDGIVNIKDLSIMASEWGTAGHRADINLDGKVNISDLSIMASQWGRKPTPSPITTTAAATAATARFMALTRPGAVIRAMVLARPAQAHGVGGLAGNDTSADPSVSADGNIVVFSSLASNLVPGDTNGVLDVFAWNRSAGTVTRVSVTAGGGQLTTASGDARISPNGRYVAFDSGADVYVKDLQTGALERISQPNGDPAGEPGQAAYADDVTSSGLVVFESKATNLVAGDTNNVSDVFVRQLQNGPIEQVSVASDSAGGAEGNAASFAGAVSGNGQYVVFASRATNLAAGNASGHAAIFVRNLAAGTTTLVSGPPGGGQANGDANFPSISADGQLVAFNSDAANLMAGNSHGYQQVYVKNLATGALRRASQANDGTAGNGDSTEPALSGDGSRVAFQSVATNLVTGDTNYAADVFVQNLAGHLISRVSVTPGLAQGNSSSLGPSLNGNGTIVAFSSDATNLTRSAASTPEQVVARAITGLPLSGGKPAITGRAKVGYKLTAHAGRWGPSGVRFRYRWYANGRAIAKATGRGLKLAAAQRGKRITVRVTASLAGYATATATSRATAKIAAGTITAARPRITGKVRAGSVLTARAGTWRPSGVRLRYRWYVNGKVIRKAAGRRLRLLRKWAGKRIRVRVTGSKRGYRTVSRSSKRTRKVAR